MSKLQSLDIVVHTVIDEQLTKFSITYPSHGAPDVETLLSLVIGHINDELGTEYTWIHKSEIGKMLDATVSLMQVSTYDPERKARIKKNIKELGY